MILCLDVGNSQIYGGLFEGKTPKLYFRKNSKTGSSSDELGLFLKGVLRENNFDPDQIRQIAICTVVPDVIHSLKGACQKYFGVDAFVFQPGVKSGLKIKYRNPVEVGSDRIVNAVAAVQRFPHTNLIIVDFGTATTFCAVNKGKDYLGGVIVAGLRIQMEALEAHTAKLPIVEILRPQSILGRSTIESIQSGLYFGHLGMVREICAGIQKECFDNQRPTIIGTGGFSRLFEGSDVFDAIIPDLVLNGLLISLKLNSSVSVGPARQRAIKAKVPEGDL